MSHGAKHNDISGTLKPAAIDFIATQRQQKRDSTIGQLIEMKST